MREWRHENGNLRFYHVLLFSTDRNNVSSNEVANITVMTRRGIKIDGGRSAYSILPLSNISFKFTNSNAVDFIHIFIRSSNVLITRVILRSIECNTKL